MTTPSHNPSPLPLQTPPPPPPATTFQLFPLLPVEIQTLVYKEASKEWMITPDTTKPESLLSWPKKLSFGVYIQVNKSRLEYYEDFSHPVRAARGAKGGVTLLRTSEEVIFVLPPLLGVCRLSRSVVYDTLTEGLVGKGEMVDLYCEDYYDADEDDYGVRIQDFRHSGLSGRVMEEEERLEKSEEERDVWQSKIVFNEAERKYDLIRGREWVVLPQSRYYKNEEWDGRMVVDDEGRVVPDHS